MKGQRTRGRYGVQTNKTLRNNPRVLSDADSKALTYLEYSTSFPFYNYGRSLFKQEQTSYEEGKGRKRLCPLCKAKEKSALKDFQRRRMCRVLPFPFQCQKFLYRPRDEMAGCITCKENCRYKINPDYFNHLPRYEDHKLKDFQIPEKEKIDKQERKKRYKVNDMGQHRVKKMSKRMAEALEEYPEEIKVEPTYKSFHSKDYNNSIAKFSAFSYEAQLLDHPKMQKARKKFPSKSNAHIVLKDRPSKCPCGDCFKCKFDNRRKLKKEELRETMDELQEYWVQYQRDGMLYYR
ncbi:hypothetical protein FGO68_gene3878 [Halteria grandinella]|uniref:Uncharacterized protein n=1 Tax=Halteria grandinella TaxID=5974 RepID=A0A8J8NS72_HALGN|nr:hypothetical protein FGO68_gene3878 [Halteria grandinella]